MSSICNHTLCSTKFCPHCGEQIIRAPTKQKIRDILDHKIYPPSGPYFYQTPEPRESYLVSKEKDPAPNMTKPETLKLCGIKFATYILNHDDSRLTDYSIDYWLREFIKAGITKPSHQAITFMTNGTPDGKTTIVTPYAAEHKYADPGASVEYINHIDVPLYYSRAYDKIYEEDEIKEKIKFANKWFSIGESNFKTIQILNVKILINNEEIDRLLEIADERDYWASLKNLTLIDKRPTRDQLLFE